MHWISILLIMGAFMKFALSGCERDLFPLANYCPANYERARQAFIHAIGTINEEDVFTALYYENIHFQNAQRTGAHYNPNGPFGKAMLRAFYPDDREWRHTIVSLGRQLLLQFLSLFDLCTKKVDDKLNEHLTGSM